MKLNLDKIPTCLINLEHRTERLERSMNELKNFFPKKDIITMKAIEHRKPVCGIGQSHLKCIQLAKQNNWPYVIVCEDDLKFQSINSKKHSKLCFNNAPEDFDILLGGIYTSAKLTSYNDYWDKTGEFSGLHFYVVNSKCYDKLLSFECNEHIDRWIGKQKDLNCYVAKEFFCIQYNGFSDNVCRDMDYSYLLKRFKLLK